MLPLPKQLEKFSEWFHKPCDFEKNRAITEKDIPLLYRPRRKTKCQEEVGLPQCDPGFESEELKELKKEITALKQLLSSLIQQSPRTDDIVPSKDDNSCHSSDRADWLSEVEQAELVAKNKISTVDNQSEGIDLCSIYQYRATCMRDVAHKLSCRYQPSFGCTVQPLPDTRVEVYRYSDSSSSDSDDHRCVTSPVCDDILCDLKESDDENVKQKQTNATVIRSLEEAEHQKRYHAEDASDVWLMSDDEDYRRSEGEFDERSWAFFPESENVKAVPNNFEATEVTHLRNSQSLTFDECSRIHRDILEISRRNRCRISEILFVERTLDIQYLKPSDQDEVNALDKFKKELRDYQMLLDEKIDVTFSEVTLLSTAKRTAQKSIGIGQETEISVKRFTKLTALINVESQGATTRYALSCGHDKMMNDEGCVHASVYTRYANVDENACRTLVRGEKKRVKVVHVQCSDWCDSNNNSHSVDAALLSEIGSDGDRLRQYIKRTMYVARFGRECRVRIYVDGTVSENATRFRVQRFDEKGIQGTVVGFSPSINGCAENRPIYNVLEIQGDDQNEIHVSGDSGLLVTTVLDESQLVQHGDYCIGTVKAVGMLIGLREEPTRCSLAIPISKTLSYLQQYIFENKANLTIVGREKYLVDICTANAIASHLNRRN